MGKGNPLSVRRPAIDGQVNRSKRGGREGCWSIYHSFFFFLSKLVTSQPRLFWRVLKSKLSSCQTEAAVLVSESGWIWLGASSWGITVQVQGQLRHVAISHPGERGRGLRTSWKAMYFVWRLDDHWNLSTRCFPLIDLRLYKSSCRS